MLAALVEVMSWAVPAGQDSRPWTAAAVVREQVDIV
jgi:hypothetical protein